MVGSYLVDRLARAADSLQQADVRYALCGGVAMVLSGRERSTRDLDIVAVLGTGQLDRLKSAARGHGFAHHDRADRRVLEGTVRYRFWLPAGDTGLSRALDVQDGSTPFHAEILARARPVAVMGRQVPVATPEDLVLLKVLAFRAIDRADAIELVRLHGPELDRGYLNRWAKSLDVEERLREVLEASESG